MAAPLGSIVRELITLAEKELQQVHLARHDATPECTIVDLECRYGQYDVRITEVFGPSWRRYSYYVLDGSALVVGFDNAADRLAIRLKHGDDWLLYINERIPHRHGPASDELALTDEMTCEAFIIWLKTILPLD